MGNLKATRRHEKMTTFLLLLGLTVSSMIISDAGVIIGLAGAIMGSTLVYIFPGILYLFSTNELKQPLRTRRIRLERMLCRFLIVFGTFTSCAGISTMITR